MKLNNILREHFDIIRYSENNISAGIIYDGNYKLIATGFPFETVLEENK